MTLREKYPTLEFFWLVFSRIWTEFGVIRSLFIPNAGIYRPESLQIRTIFTQYHTDKNIFC